jgi:ribosomal protein S3
VPLHTLRADVDYGFTEAATTMGRIGIKVWIYRGDVLPEIGGAVIEEAPVDVIASKDIYEEKIVHAEGEETVTAEEAVEKPKVKRTTKAKAPVETEDIKEHSDIAVEEKTGETSAAEGAEKIAKPRAKRKAKVDEEIEEVAEKPAKTKAKKKDAAEEA